MNEIWSVNFQENFKIVDTRRQIFRRKCTKFDFDWSFAPDTAGTAYSAPRPLAESEMLTSKMREEKEMKRGAEGIRKVERNC